LLQLSQPRREPLRVVEMEEVVVGVVLAQVRLGHLHDQQELELVL